MPHWFVYYDHLDCSCVISLGVSETNFYLVAALLLARDTPGNTEHLIVSNNKYGTACPLKLVCPLPYLAIPNTFISGSAPLNFKFIPALSDLSELKMFPIRIWILMRKWKHLCKSVHFVSQKMYFFKFFNTFRIGRNKSFFFLFRISAEKSMLPFSCFSL